MSKRIRNIHNRISLGHPENDKSSPSGVTVHFDGQSYFIGPNERMSNMNDGIIVGLVAQNAASDVEEDRTADDSGGYQTENEGVFGA